MKEKKMLGFNKNKRGAVLDMAQMFIIGLMALAILGVLTIIIMNSLGSVSSAQNSNSFVNKSGAYVNTTGYQLTPLTTTGGAVPGAYSVSAVWANVSGSPYLIPSANYTVSSTGLLTNATVVPDATAYNDANVSYTARTYITTITNVTAAVPNFFSNAATWLTLLGVVVIVAVVVIVLRFFGGPRFGEAMGPTL